MGPTYSQGVWQVGPECTQYNNHEVCVLDVGQTFPEVNLPGFHKIQDFCEWDLKHMTRWYMLHTFSILRN